jgi:quercetin dioxygenase-like cupin family protein
MQVVRAGELPTGPGPSSWFTGPCGGTRSSRAEPPSRLRVHVVTLVPGSRTNWHTHPLGQVLHVTSGSGLVGRDDGTVERVSGGASVRAGPL